MTKQEIIKKAFGEYWEQLKDYADENGFCDAHKTLSIFSSFKEQEIDMSGNYWRPLSLKGIEDNNGWLSIEFHGLPNKEDTYWIKDNAGITTAYFKANKFLYTENHEAITTTHYQPITKPLNPIY
jgi:hypothetical protein